MPVFEYVAINTNGREIKGTVDADSIRAARQRLRVQEIFPTQIREAKAATTSAKIKDIRKILTIERVSLKSLATATRLFATLLNAGLPLVSALQSLSEQIDSVEFKRIIFDIKEKVEQGSSLAKSLALYPKVFPRLYVNMVASGEVSGTLDSVLQNLAEYLESQLELRRKISSALFYPVLMLLFCTAVIIGLVTFVVPNIVDIFVKQKVALPLPTQIVIGFSHIITGYWWALIILALSAVAGVRSYYRSPAGRQKCDMLLLKAPLYGSLYKKIVTARVSSTLGTLLSSGVELLTALDIVRNIVGNVHMAKAIEEARDGVREGRSLAKELGKSGYYPNLLSQMIAIGERSGRLEAMLSRAGNAFMNEVNATVSGLTSLIEPLMIFVVGGIVFAIVISVLLPMTELMHVVQPGH